MDFRTGGETANCHSKTKTVSKLGQESAAGTAPALREKCHAAPGQKRGRAAGTDAPNLAEVAEGTNHDPESLPPMMRECLAGGPTTILSCLPEPDEYQSETVWRRPNGEPITFHLCSGNRRRSDEMRLLLEQPEDLLATTETDRE